MPLPCLAVLVLSLLPCTHVLTAAEAGPAWARVIIDFVPGHTSIDHPWFKESAKAGKNAYSNWYVWTDRTWVSGVDRNQYAFIQGYSERDGCFLTNSFWQEPALEAQAGFKVLYAEKNAYPFAYLRSAGKQHILVVLNPKETPATVELTLDYTPVAVDPLAGNRGVLRHNGNKLAVEMPGASFSILRVNAE